MCVYQHALFPSAPLHLREFTLDVVTPIFAFGSNQRFEVHEEAPDDVSDADHLRASRAKDPLGGHILRLQLAQRFFLAELFDLPRRVLRHPHQRRRGDRLPILDLDIRLRHTAHARILRPLWWLGLLEHRIVKDSEANTEVTEFKKIKSFDKIFKFHID